MSGEDIVKAAASFSFESASQAPMRSPIMVVGDTPASRTRGLATCEASGLRVVGELTPLEALERLEEQAGLSALWIELDESPSVGVHRLLSKADADSRRRHLGVVVATRLEHVDEVWGEIAGSEIDLLVNADESERIATLALATSRAEPLAVRDVASDASAARLRQLSEEVTRIAAALSRLSTASAGPPLSPATMAPPAGHLPAVSAEGLRSIIRARRLRASYLPGDLFADPAWDMLLDLLQAEIVQHRVPVSSLCIAAAVPATTALRWIKAMTDRGLLVRRDDPHDGRRVSSKWRQRPVPHFAITSRRPVWRRFELGLRPLHRLDPHDQGDAAHHLGASRQVEATATHLLPQS